MNRYILFGGVFICNTLSVYSQQDTSSRLLDEVVLTAQRQEQKNWLVPYSIQSLSATHLESYEPRTAPEALTGVSGVFVQKTNHGGGSPILRGLTGNQTLIMIDGIRMNNATYRYGPNQYLTTIDGCNIRKMEVAKGTGSVQYGTDALGGVIQVFTKEPNFAEGKPKWNGRLSGKYMSSGMEKTLRGEAAYRSQKLAVQAGATYRDFGDLVGGDTTGRQTPSGYKELAFDAKTKIFLQPHAELTLAHQFLQQQHVPVYHKVVLENFALNEMAPQQRMLNYAKLNVGTKNKKWNRVEMIASWQQSIEGRSSRKNGSNTIRKERDETNTAGLTTDITSRFSKVWTANSGIEIYLDKVNSLREDINLQDHVKTNSRGLYPDGASYHNYSLFSLHHFSFNRWSIDGGIRYNTFLISISDTSLGKVSITPSSMVYNAALMYHLSPQHHLYISYSTGYRAPNVDDMGTLGIVDFRYEIPSKDLAPEKSRNVELGYKVRTRRWTAALSGYYMHLNDLIARSKIEGKVINGYPVYKKENIDKAFIKGLEAAVDYEPLTGWKVSGHVAYTYGQNSTKNEPLRRIPPLNGRLRSSYHRNKWFGTAEILFAVKQDRLAQGDKEDNRIPKGGTPGWKTVNLYSGYELRHIRFTMAVQNVLDEDYRTHGSGINGAGRSAWLSVAVKM